MTERRIAGEKGEKNNLSLLKAVAAPIGFTALTYGVGKLSGQDDQRALSYAVPGVAGAYLGEAVASKLAPWSKVNIPVKGKKIPLNLGGIAGAYLGGLAGSKLGESIDSSLRPDVADQQGEINPLLNIVDELSMPAFAVGRALLSRGR